MPGGVIQNNVTLFRSFGEIWAGRRGKSFQRSMVREYTRKFRAIVTDRDATPDDICFADGAPLPFSPFVSAVRADLRDIRALCVELSAEQEHTDDWQSWILTAEYSTDVPEGGPDLRFQVNRRPADPAYIGNQPWLWRPKIEWDFQERNNAAPVKDLDGLPYLNSAIQPFNPPANFEEAYPVLVVIRNELNVDQTLINKYSYAVNSDDFLGAPPGCAQCLPLRATEQYQGDMEFFRVTYRIRFSTEEDENGDLIDWQPRVLDCGTMKLQKILGLPYSNQPVPIFRNGHAVTYPVLLDGNGSPKQPNTKGVIEPVFLKFRKYPARPFAKIMTGGLGGGAP